MLIIWISLYTFVQTLEFTFDRSDFFVASKPTLHSLSDHGIYHSKFRFLSMITKTLWILARYKTCGSSQSCLAYDRRSGGKHTAWQLCEGNRGVIGWTQGCSKQGSYVMIMYFDRHSHRVGSSHPHESCVYKRAIFVLRKSEFGSTESWSLPRRDLLYSYKNSPWKSRQYFT